MKRLALLWLLAVPLAAQNPSPPNLGTGAILGFNGSGVGLWVDQYCFVKATRTCTDGTDDTPAIQAAENARLSGQTLFFTPGRTYNVASMAAANVLRVKSPGTWTLNGATIRYTGAANVTTGGDGGVIPLISVEASPFAMGYGTLDGGTHGAWLLGFRDNQTGGVFLQFLTIQNCFENAATPTTWNCLAFAVSQDVTGVAIGGRAPNISGVISRPNAPIANSAGTIVSHANISAYLVGGPNSGQGNATGFAMTTQSGSDTQLEFLTNGRVGVAQFISNSGTEVTNNTWTDVAMYDLGARRIELYGELMYATHRQSFGIGGAFTPGLCEAAGAIAAVQYIVTVTANVAVTINNPSTNCGGGSVDRIVPLQFHIRNTSGGALTTPVTFTGGLYKVTATVSPTTGQEIVVVFSYDLITGNITEISRSGSIAF